MSDHRLSDLEYSRSAKRLRRFFPELDDIDFSCKKVAYLGTGDQEGYPDKFMDAMGFWAENIAEEGGETVDYWPVDG
jgi:flavodoxin I